MPFGCKAKAAPTSDGRSARSTIVTRAATRLSTKLAVSPPIPAPTTTAWSTIHTVDAVDHETAVVADGTDLGMNEEQPTLAANPLPACATERSRLLPAFQPETFRKLAREKMWPDVEHIPVIGRLANILGWPSDAGQSAGVPLVNDAARRRS
jgi:hypothetical protein